VTTRRLHLASDLSLPLEAVTQTFAILAKRGVGKTYAALVMVEEMLRAGLHVCVADPIGVCWGLRAAANGKDPGLPIVVLGGDHQDAPLEVTAGEVIADLVVDERLSVVLDLSLFRKGEQTRFMTDFAERLYHRNREPVHLVLDEADAFAPQRPMKGQERMLGAVEDLVRRGRARGIGVTLVTQRAAVLAKDVLTQVEVLVALRTIAPQDREAIDAWIKVHGTPEQREQLMTSLPSLPVGTAWFWSPGWLDVFQRVNVRARETFDSSATPRAGAKPIEPKQLAPVDPEALKKRLAATIERAKAEDPRELRKQIAELKRQLRAAEASKSQPERPSKPASVLTDGDRARLEKLAVSVEQVASLMHEDLVLAGERMKDALALVGGEYGGAVIAAAAKAENVLKALLEKASVAKTLDKLKTAGRRDELTSRASPAAAPQRRADLGSRVRQPSLSGPLTDGTQQRTIDTIAMLNVRGLAVTREAAARWIGIHPNGGRYLSGLAQLREDNLLDGWTLTPKGEAAARPVETGINATLATLKDGTCRRSLEELVAAHPRALTREQLAERLGIHPNGGRFLSGLAWLRQMGVISERSPIGVTEGAFR